MALHEQAVKLNDEHSTNKMKGLYMSTDRKIEHYLNGDERDKYSIKNYGFVRIIKEVYGNAEDLKKIYDQEIPRIESFRADLASSLTSDKSKQPDVAVKWIDFLKPRIDVLDFWSTFFTSLVGIMAAAATLFTVIGLAVDGEKPLLELGVFALVTTIFVALKFSVDKKKHWYKYLSGHLESIAKAKST